MKKTTKTYVMKTDSQGNVTTHSDVQVSGSGSSESGEPTASQTFLLTNAALQPRCGVMRSRSACCRRTLRRR